MSAVETSWSLQSLDFVKGPGNMGEENWAVAGCLRRVQGVRSIVSEQDKTKRGPEVVKLQILIRKDWRNEEGINRIRDLLRDLRIDFIDAGQATLSAEMPAADFQELFGTGSVKIEPQGPGESDFGRSGGYAAGELAVPAQLRPYVESISVPPPHIRM